MQTPVAFLIFNRPDTTQAVFNAIQKAKPDTLLVVADGPRSEEERGRCLQARAIINQVDWDCTVYTQYSETNLGCKMRVASGLDWVFSIVEEAIILEDDCLPNSSFFPYCTELLDRYRDDERVMMVSGQNLSSPNIAGPYSYYFSHHNYIWGWATWARAWKHYDINIRLWPELRERTWLYDLLGDENEMCQWKLSFDSVNNPEFNTWDTQWAFSWWAQSGYSILPMYNLVSNIGFGDSATHTHDSSSPLANLSTREIELPLRHPPYMVLSREIVQDHVRVPTLRKFLFHWIKKKASVLAGRLRR